MKFKPLALMGLIALVIGGAGGYALYSLGMQRGVGRAGTSAAAASGAATQPAMTPNAGPMSIAQGEDATRRHIADGLKAGDIDPATGKKILYYHDPMVPGNKFDKPAKSPFMDMMLVPVYGGDAADAGKVTVSPRIQQNLGVRTAQVIEGMLSPQLAAVGNIAFNERDQAIVQARATGYVERLHVRATLDRVAQGQALAELYVPDWIAAQEEFLSVRRMKGTDLDSLVDAARQRMRQVGMNDVQIALVEAGGQTQPRISLVAPISGVITELMVREGMTVMAGATLFRINSLATVWANAEVPESQAALLRPGAKVQAKSPAAPGVTFSGRVQAILPEVNPATRTLKARLELANPGGRLVPGMFVQMQFMDMHKQKALLVPTEAIIQTGTRTVVMLAEENGRFRPVEVDIGIESAGQSEVKRGLKAGQSVVVSSQFLLDSEASLRGIETRLESAPVAPAAAPAANATGSVPGHRGQGRVEAINREAITLSHGPIQSLGMGGMTMDFKLPSADLVPHGLVAGDQVDFEFRLDPNEGPIVTRLKRLAPLPAASAPGAGASR